MCSDAKGSKVAATAIRVLRVSPDGARSLVACRPLTGRTHQIRVHLQALGHPIANDALYGGEAGAPPLPEPTGAEAPAADAAASGAPAAEDDAARYAPRQRLAGDAGAAAGPEGAQEGDGAADAAEEAAAASAAAAAAAAAPLARAIGVGVVSAQEGSASSAWGGGERDALCGHCPHLGPQARRRIRARSNPLRLPCCDAAGARRGRGNLK